MRVVERALKSSLLDAVYVATDSEAILKAVQNHGGNALLTSEDHQSGTDRCLLLVTLDWQRTLQSTYRRSTALDPVMIEEVVRPLLRYYSHVHSIYEIVRTEITHPNAVKTVVDREGFAIYFSRSTIPFFRDSKLRPVYYKHHGIYAYRNDFLQTFANLPQGFFERAEHLEQLRALENGFRIKVVITDKDSIEVDTGRSGKGPRNIRKDDLTKKKDG
jgi:3-deoxy-manno-octulosonate cytidylyltransferase (CMP-KDO synthetase)